MDNFWKKYQEELKDGYYKVTDNEKCLKPEFIVEYPEEIARRLKHFRKNKLSQIWKFYNQAVRIQECICQRKESFERWKAELYALRPAVNYAKERDTVSQEFKDFVDFNVQFIKDSEDLTAFVKHFQSVIAYLPRQNQK